MGNCCGLDPRIQKSALSKIQNILKIEEIHILHLIYIDLSDRISDKKINMENFLLFFHKNGFWGERLFKEFDFDETNLISEEEFIHGIGTTGLIVAKIFKSTEREKISLLFKFFSKNTDNGGVFFNQFLTMLYNYPKEDLKQIFNDKDFIQFQLKKHIVPISDGKKIDSSDNLKRTQSVLLKSFTRDLKKAQIYRYQQGEPSENMNEQVPPSMIGKDILKNIKQKYMPKQTMISLKDGNNSFQIRTGNFHQLVKRFALRIFHQAKIDEKTGKLNFQQFYQWIIVHKALYQNYYDGFHNQVWELDPLSRQPKYLSSAFEKSSDAKTIINNSHKKVSVFLLHSILVICEEKKHQKPIEVICLEGLAVTKIMEAEYGFGIEITHRDGVYDPKKFFFKNQAIQSEWMQLLKYYKGNSVQQLYDIGQKIGTGKFSVVYKCRHNIDQKQYAIKVIQTYKLQPQARALIAHESSIMKIVSHPLLLQFKECIQTKTHIYIVTELVCGKDLFQFVKEYRYLQEEDAAIIMQQIIVGVRFLHSFQIVHRDLKPENIMVVLDEQAQQISNIKIIDFGFANYLSTLNQKNSQEVLAGTPNYIAPEILRQEQISFKVDNFAIGAILYFMLSGTLPFNDYNITQILKKTMSGEYNYKDKRWNSISSEAKNLIDDLLKNNPDERITLENALKHPWFKIIKDKKSRKMSIKVKRQESISSHAIIF